MKITIANRIKLENPPEILKNYLVDMLRHKNPEFLEAEKLGKSTRNIPEFIHFFEFDTAANMYIPRGMRQPLFSLMRSLNLVAERVHDKRTLIKNSPYVDGSKISYRPYQEPAIQELLGTNPEGILVAPPGSGKTVMGLSLLPILQQPALWLTHTYSLFKQCHERALSFIPILQENDVGMIGAGKWSVGTILTIGMIPTLVRNLDKLAELENKFGLVILDEAHHCPASTFLKVISILNPYFLYGLTATPYRRDGLENLMFQCIGPVTAEITKAEVAKHKGIIAPKIIYCGLNTGPKIDMANTNTILKHYIVYNEQRNKRICDDVIREAKAGNFCIVASGRKAHCEILFEMIKTRWPKVGIATGKYNKKFVDEQIRAFNNNEITVLITTPELLGEGFDVDFLNRLFITTSFRTESRAEQLIGRIQRFHPDKEDSLVYEYVDENIGVFVNQFKSGFGKCRYNVYKRLGLEIIPYSKYMEVSTERLQ